MRASLTLRSMSPASAARARAEWEDLAGLDPLFAVLSHPGKRGGGWDAESFFATGSDYVRVLMARAASLGLPRAREAALDYGCGVGRLTRALAAHFESCLGVDVSRAMIEHARRLNAGWPSCRFLPIDTPAELAEGAFDLVLCKAVVQHLPGRSDQTACLTGLARALRPGGLLAVQVPSRLPLRRRLQLLPRLYRALRGLGLEPKALYERLGLTPIRMAALSRVEVEQAIRAGGARVLALDANVGDSEDETYFAGK